LRSYHPAKNYGNLNFSTVHSARHSGKIQFFGIFA
jgi:hypothetical protein